jgi:ADP-ribose pyrophosphatase YjhB (NUDIX family)
VTATGTLRYRLSRLAGRVAMRTAAALTLGRMPPFVSASVVVVDGDQVLAVIDPIRGEPILPGGHLKWREKPDVAAIRETREETGYVVEVLDLLAVLAGSEWAGEEGIVRVVYAAHVAAGALASSPEGEATWLSLSSLANSDTRDAPIVRLWQQRQATSVVRN